MNSTIQIEKQHEYLLVPEEFLAVIPEDTLNDEAKRKEYLLSALKNGLQAMSNASNFLSIAQTEKATQASVEQYEEIIQQCRDSLDTLITDKPVLAEKLENSFGEKASLMNEGAAPSNSTSDLDLNWRELNSRRAHEASLGALECFRRVSKLSQT